MSKQIPIDDLMILAPYGRKMRVEVAFNSYAQKFTAELLEGINIVLAEAMAPSIEEAIGLLMEQEVTYG